MTSKEKITVEYFNKYHGELQRISKLKGLFEQLEAFAKSQKIFNDFFDVAYQQGYNEGYNQGLEKGVENWENNKLKSE